MEQRRSDVAVKDAQIMSSEEEFALSMEQWLLNANDATALGAQIELWKVEFALSTGQSSNYASVKVAQIMPLREVCARGMEQRPNYALLVGAQIKSSKEDFALGMGQRSRGAAVMDARIMLLKEECIWGMEQSANYAAVMDAQILSSGEECVLGMEQRSNDAASVDALTIPNEIEFAKDMGPIRILLTNPLHLIYHRGQHTTKQLQLFPIMIMQLLLTKRGLEILQVLSANKSSITSKSRKNVVQ